jgi:hypothetical protein
VLQAGVSRRESCDQRVRDLVLDLDDRKPIPFQCCVFGAGLMEAVTFEPLSTELPFERFERLVVVCWLLLSRHRESDGQKAQLVCTTAKGGL